MEGRRWRFGFGVPWARRGVGAEGGEGGEGMWVRRGDEDEEEGQGGEEDGEKQEEGERVGGRVEDGAADPGGGLGSADSPREPTTAPAASPAAPASAPAPIPELPQTDLPAPPPSKTPSDILGMDLDPDEPEYIGGVGKDFRWRKWRGLEAELRREMRMLERRLGGDQEGDWEEDGEDEDDAEGAGEGEGGKRENGVLPEGVSAYRVSIF